MNNLILFAFIIVLILIDFGVVVMSLRFKSKELHWTAVGITTIVCYFVFHLIKAIIGG